MKKKEKYTLTEEHRALLPQWRDKWIANAMSTKPMDAEDRRITREAIKGLYRSANLAVPPDHRIVFVSSPFIARFAGGFAAAIWYLRGSGKEARDTTDEATNRVTLDATDAATNRATSEAISNDWYAFDSSSMKRLSRDLGLGLFGLKCAFYAYRMYQGGNFWSPWASFLSFFRHVAKLDIDYSKWDHWEKAAIHSSYRIIHKEFCIVSDRPKTLLVDAQNRPHCDTGPFCEWRDGSALYAIHGTRVPGWVVETPADKLNVKDIMALKNAEHRLIALKKIGPERMLEALKAKDISHKGSEYTLYAVTLEGSDERLLRMKNPSEDKQHYEWVAPECRTVTEALAWRRGITVYTEPVAKT